MGGLFVTWMTFERFPIDGMLVPTLVVAIVWAWRRLGYERHVRRIAEIERRIARRSAQEAGA